MKQTKTSLVAYFGVNFNCFVKTADRQPHIVRLGQVLVFVDKRAVQSFGQLLGLLLVAAHIVTSLWQKNYLFQLSGLVRVGSVLIRTLAFFSLAWDTNRLTELKFDSLLFVLVSWQTATTHESDDILLFITETCKDLRKFLLKRLMIIIRGRYCHILNEFTGKMIKSLFITVLWDPCLTCLYFVMFLWLMYC